MALPTRASPTPPSLERHAVALRDQGVSTSTFGVGADFDERLLQAMADAGGGRFYFIESAAQIRDHITSEVGESLDVVARDVRVWIEAPEGVTVTALSAHRSERQGDRTAIVLGDLVSEQRLSLVVQLNFPYGDVGRSHGVRIGWTSREAAETTEAPIELGFEYADDRTNDLQPRDRDVDRAVAQAHATRVRKEALELNRQGRFAEASARLDAVAQRIRTYAASDRVMLDIVARLELDRGTMAAPMAPMAMKAAFWASETMDRGRSPQGRAVKGPDQLTRTTG